MSDAGADAMIAELRAAGEAYDADNGDTRPAGREEVDTSAETHEPADDNRSSRGGREQRQPQREEQEQDGSEELEAADDDRARGSEANPAAKTSSRIPDALRERALRFMPVADMRHFATAEQLEAAVDNLEVAVRRFGGKLPWEQQQEEPPAGGKKTPVKAPAAQEAATEGEVEDPWAWVPSLKPEEYDEGYINELKGLHGHQRKLVEHVYKDLGNRFTGLVKHLIAQEEDREAQAFESAMTALAGESPAFAAKIGKTSLEEMSDTTPELKVWQEVFAEASRIADKNRQLGRRVPPVEKLVRTAFTALYGDLSEHVAQERVLDDVERQLEERSRSAAPAPTRQRPAQAPKGRSEDDEEEEEVRAYERSVRKLGVTY